MRDANYQAITRAIRGTNREYERNEARLRERRGEDRQGKRARSGKGGGRERERGRGGRCAIV